MKNKAFEGFLFKITHPVSYDFTAEERELIAENVAVKTKITTGANIDIADVRHLINDGSGKCLMADFGRMLGGNDDGIDALHAAVLAVLHRVHTAVQHDACHGYGIPGVP